MTIIIKCRRCNEEKQHKAHGLCLQCYLKEYSKKYRDDHYDDLRLRKQQYDKENRDKGRLRLQRWREKQPDYCGGMKENVNSPDYLGVYIGERVLKQVFKNIQHMPKNNPGFDFICDRGYKVDVKTACRQKHEKYSDIWKFRIKQNITADYFLCLAFDNRNNLNAEHLWLIPGNDINTWNDISISESKINKWKKYEINDKLFEVINICNNYDT